MAGLTFGGFQMASSTLTAAAAMQAVADAVHELRVEARAHRPAPVPLEVRGYVSDLRVPGWVAVALRLCVDHAAGTSLAQQLRPVPEEYLHGVWVECACGTGSRRAQLVECPGGCGRWLLGDESGVWAFRLPDPS